MLIAPGRIVAASPIPKHEGIIKEACRLPGLALPNGSLCADEVFIVYRKISPVDKKYGAFTSL